VTVTVTMMLLLDTDGGPRIFVYKFFFFFFFFFPRIVVTDSLVTLTELGEFVDQAGKLIVMTLLRVRASHVLSFYILSSKTIYIVHYQQTIFP
jgi:hypothetical protein